MVLARLIVIPGRAKREPGIHNHRRSVFCLNRGYGLRIAAPRLPE